MFIAAFLYLHHRACLCRSGMRIYPLHSSIYAVFLLQHCALYPTASVEEYAVNDDDERK